MIPDTNDQIEVSVRVNGIEHHLTVDAGTTTLELLRDELLLTGTKLSCGEQRCGVCTVLVDGRPISACTYLAYELRGTEVLTIEGLASDGELDTLQTTFVEENALQCGFCTPGMIMTARALLNDIERPTERQIRSALSGNICRCTGYDAIVRAVASARDREAP